MNANLTPFEASRSGMRNAFGCRVGSATTGTLVARINWNATPHNMEREVRAMIRNFRATSTDRIEQREAAGFLRAFCTWNAPKRVAAARKEACTPLTARDFVS